jgi:hypothetical protein
VLAYQVDRVKGARAAVGTEDRTTINDVADMEAISEQCTSAPTANRIPPSFAIRKGPPLGLHASAVEILGQGTYGAKFKVAVKMSRTVLPRPTRPRASC